MRFHKETRERRKDQGKTSPRRRYVVFPNYQFVFNFSCFFPRANMWVATRQIIGRLFALFLLSLCRYRPVKTRGNAREVCGNESTGWRINVQGLNKTIDSKVLLFLFLCFFYSNICALPVNIGTISKLSHCSTDALMYII